MCVPGNLWIFLFFLYGTRGNLGHSQKKREGNSYTYTVTPTHSHTQTAAFFNMAVS